MDLDVSQSEVRQTGIHKQIFEQKAPRKDGLILQIHHTFPGPSGEIRRIRFIHVAYSDSGEQIAAADHRGNVFIIDLASSKFWLLANLGMCTAVAFSPCQSKQLLVAITTGTVHILNIETGKSVASLVGHATPVTQMSFAQNRYCLSASSQEAIIWDLQSNSQAHRLSMRNDVLIKKVLFMPITNYILVCFQDDAIHIWKFESFQFIKQIVPEAWKSYHIKSIAFTRNGRAMVIGGQSPSLVIFSLDSWAVIKVVDLPDGIPGVAHVEFIPQLFDGGANKVLGILTTTCKVYFLDTDLFAYLGSTIEPGSSIRTFTCSPSGKYITLILRSGEVNMYTSAKVIEARKPEEPQKQQVEATTKVPTVPRKVSTFTERHLEAVQKQIQETLDLSRLQPILKEFGEYPESYRPLIWKTILKVPENREAYVGLVKRNCHVAYLNLDKHYPLENKGILKNLKQLLSCLAHWCPLFAEVKFLPLFVFPFVRVFQNDPFTCFEVVATVLVNWCQYWFEYFPYPPVNILTMIENILAEHDPELLALFCKVGVTSHLFALPLLESAFSEVLSSSEWLQFWDHVLSNEPSFLLMAVVAYNMTCRAALQSCKTMEDFQYFFHNQNPIDMKRFIAKTYALCKRTSQNLHPRQYLNELKSLTREVYPIFTQYPKFIVDEQAQEMAYLRQEEEKYKQKQEQTLKQKEALERKRKEDLCKEIQEARLRKLEEAMRNTVRKEEERLANQRLKITSLRHDVQSKNLELLDAAREKIMHQHVRQREAALNRMLDDLAHKQLQEDSEMAVVEQELQEHYTNLLMQKHKLEQEVGFPHEAVPGPSIEHRILLQQQEKLKRDLLRLRQEASSKQHNRHVEISSRIALLDDLLQRVEMQLAREMAERQNDLISSQGKIKVMQLEKETKALETEVAQLLEKVSAMRLLEGKRKLQEVVESHADRRELKREEEELLQTFSVFDVESNTIDGTHNLIKDYLTKGYSSDVDSANLTKSNRRKQSSKRNESSLVDAASGTSRNPRAPPPSYASNRMTEPCSKPVASNRRGQAAARRSLRTKKGNSSSS